MWQVYFCYPNTNQLVSAPRAGMPLLNFQKFATQNLFICKRSYPMKYKRFV